MQNPSPAQQGPTPKLIHRGIELYPAHPLSAEQRAACRQAAAQVHVSQRKLRKQLLWLSQPPSSIRKPLQSIKATEQGRTRLIANRGRNQFAHTDRGQYYRTVALQVAV